MFFRSSSGFRDAGLRDAPRGTMRPGAIALAAVVSACLLALAAPAPANAQTAAEAAAAMANVLDSASRGVSRADSLAALENAAAAGQPMALWELGRMYENGVGVARDPVKAFGYYSRIANDHADTSPRALEADIVAKSFVKVGQYYREGLPDAGITVNVERSHALLMHAATYFGDADAQYRVGLLYLDADELGRHPLQAARWLSLAARKGHVAAQATLGNLLFTGEGIAPQRVEGLMWLTLAQRRTDGLVADAWLDDMLSAAVSSATPEDLAEARALADRFEDQFDG